MPLSDDAKTFIALEKKFWDAIQRKDGPATAAMTADKCVVVGAQGVGLVDRATMEKLTVEGQWTLDHYEFDETTFQALPVDADTAVVAYKVTENVTYEGAPLTLVANDASVWRRNGSEWHCVLHTESVAGDPFGRDRKP